MIRLSMIPLCALVLLAACATPQERCLRDAAAPWRAALDERIRAGDQDLVTTTVHDVTGRRPTSLREFLTVHRTRLA